MAAAKKCIIVGRNKINGVFYMLNDETTTVDNIWYTGGKQHIVRKETKPKIFESKSEANEYLRYLRDQDSSWDTQWRIETYYPPQNPG